MFGIENIFRFKDPLFLLLLFIIPFLLFYEKKFKKHANIKFSSLKIIKSAQKSKVLNNKILIVLRMLCIALFILALARPQLGKFNSEDFRKGISIILNIDTSGSMAAIDLEVNNDKVTRLDVVKKVVKEFVSKRIDDQIGLVVFGTNAFTQCPLTLDYNIINQFLDSLEIGMAGEQTAVGSSLGLAIKRLKDVPSKTKIVILLTDGRSNSGQLQPDKAADIAKSLGIKVYTVGVGTSGKIPFVQHGFFGPQIVYSQADLDEETLKMIADKTGGKYYRAKNSQELEKIYSDIDKLEKSKIKSKKYTEYNDIFPIFLIPALLLLILEIILSNTIFMKIP